MNPIPHTRVLIYSIWISVCNIEVTLNVVAVHVAENKSTEWNEPFVLEVNEVQEMVPVQLGCKQNTINKGIIHTELLYYTVQNNDCTYFKN